MDRANALVLTQCPGLSAPLAPAADITWDIGPAAGIQGGAGT